jgi:hypothetical protein
MYLNGKLDKTVTLPPWCDEWIKKNTASAPLCIGIDRYRKHPFAGIIDEVRIYNYALSEAQVGELFRSGTKPSMALLAGKTAVFVPKTTTSAQQTDRIQQQKKRSQTKDRMQSWIDELDEEETRNLFLLVGAGIMGIGGWGWYMAACYRKMKDRERANRKIMGVGHGI